MHTDLHVDMFLEALLANGPLCHTVLQSLNLSGNKPNKQVGTEYACVLWCMYVCMYVCVCVYRCCWVVAFGFPQTSLPRSPDLTIAPFGHLQAILTLANVLCNSKTLNNLYLVDCGLSSRTFLDILTAALSMHPVPRPPSLFCAPNVRCQRNV